MSEEVPKELIEKYKREAPERVREIESLIHSLEHSFSEKLLTDLRIMIHKMAGNAGTYGFMEATNLCKSFDEKLTKLLQTKPTSIDPPLLQELNDLVQKLYKIFS